MNLQLLQLDHENPWELGIISGDTEAGREQFKILQTLVTAQLSVSQVFPKIVVLFITFKIAHAKKENHALLMHKKLKIMH